MSKNSTNKKEDIQKKDVENTTSDTKKQNNSSQKEAPQKKDNGKITSKFFKNKALRFINVLSPDMTGKLTSDILYNPESAGSIRLYARNLHGLMLHPDNSRILDYWKNNIHANYMVKLSFSSLAILRAINKNFCGDLLRAILACKPSQEVLDLFLWSQGDIQLKKMPDDIEISMNDVWCAAVPYSAQGYENLSESALDNDCKAMAKAQIYCFISDVYEIKLEDVILTQCLGGELMKDDIIAILQEQKINVYPWTLSVLALSPEPQDLNGRI